MSNKLSMNFVKIKKFLSFYDYDDDLENYVYVGFSEKDEDETYSFDKRMDEYIRNNKITEWVYNIYNEEINRDVKNYYTPHTNCLCNVTISTNCFIVHKDIPNVVFIIGNICMKKFTNTDRKLKCKCGKGRLINENHDRLCSKCRNNNEKEQKKIERENNRKKKEEIKEFIRKKKEEEKLFKSFEKNYKDIMYKFINENYNIDCIDENYHRYTDIIYLNVPYSDRTLIKNMGGIWDNNKKKWFCLKSITSKSSYKRYLEIQNKDENEEDEFTDICRNK
jgi:hypothetical protein